MAEYQKMIVISAIFATLFLGGFLGPFVDRFPLLGPLYLFIKIVLLLFIMIWVRATWPRIRYDRLMAFGWKVLLPLSLAITFITATGILLADMFNNQMYFWAIPFVSTFVGLFTVVFIYRELRRKVYERA
jgi:NADH:ubiquinone oxidoreductase subunit H